MTVMTLPGQRAQWTTWWLWLIGVLALIGLLAALAVGAAVMVHPPLIGTLRPWWPPLAAVGLVSIVTGYWLLWGRRG